MSDAGHATHASQQLQKQAPVVPYVNSHTNSQHGGTSGRKAAMEMGVERISGPSDPAATANGNAVAACANDDVELEKSNILMLGPTGAVTAFTHGGRLVVS